MALADMMVVMNGGRIVQAGSPRAIFGQTDTRVVSRSSAATTSCRRTSWGFAAVWSHYAPIADLHAPGEDEVGLDAAVSLVEYQGAPRSRSPPSRRPTAA